MAECWKRSYVSATAAWAAVGRLKSRRRRGQHLKVEQRAYRCPYCGKFHLTSQDQEKRHDRQH